MDMNLHKIILHFLYENGEGTEKNLKKAFYWYQKIATNDFKVVQKYLNNDKISYKIIKIFEPMMRFIIESKDETYNRCNICHKKRRSSKENNQICIIKATWINGPPYWNEEREEFEYKGSIIVALKQLNNSRNITSKELNEVYLFNPT